MSAGSLVLTGCVGGSPDDGRLPEAITATSALRTSGGENAAALDAYRAMWQDMTLASKTSDADSPLLDDHAGGGALSLLRYMLRKGRNNEVVTRGKLHLAPAAARSGTAAVLIRDCVDATDWLHYADGGTLEDDGPGGHHRVVATVRQRGGAWRVERLYIDQVGTC